MISLDLVGVTKSFGETVAVNEFSLTVQEGELISVLGPSGCGKTTVLRCIAGFERFESGYIHLYGHSINAVPPEDRDVGIVFQTYALFPNMSVAENIAFSLMIKGRPKTERLARANELLELVQLQGFGDRSINSLSGGQKQRVALARALARAPKVLLLDEPLSALDAKIREELRIEIRRIQTRLGITTLYVTHDQEEALSISDRVVVMNKGVIHQVGAPSEIYLHPQTLFVAGFVGTMNLVKGAIAPDGRFAWASNSMDIARAQGIPAGSPAVLGLRPEDLSLALDRGSIPPTYNVIEAFVEPITFLGAIQRVILRTRDGVQLKVDLPIEKTSGLEQGKLVFVHFPRDAGLVMKETE